MLYRFFRLLPVLFRGEFCLWQKPSSKPSSMLLSVACAILLSLGATAPAAAQGKSVVIVGDSIANDLSRGMRDYFAGSSRVNVVTKTRHSTGLVRTDYFDWFAHMRKVTQSTPGDVMVIVMGGNDRQAIRTKGRRLDRFSKAWLAEYERRVARFMAIAKKARSKIYWVGLPPVRSDIMTRHYRIMNAIFRRQAAKHDIAYISVWKSFTDAKGGYSSFGKSVSGVERRLRKKDGMHFNKEGTLKLAALVARSIGVSR